MDCRRLNWPEKLGLQGNYLVQECRNTMKSTVMLNWQNGAKQAIRACPPHPSCHKPTLVSFSSSLKWHTTCFYYKHTWKMTWKYWKRSKTGRWQQLEHVGNEYISLPMWLRPLQGAKVKRLSVGNKFVFVWADYFCSLMIYCLFFFFPQFREQKLVELVFFLFRFSGGKFGFLKHFLKHIGVSLSTLVDAPYSVLLQLHPSLVLEDIAPIIFVGYKTKP